MIPQALRDGLWPYEMTAEQRAELVCYHGDGEIVCLKPEWDEIHDPLGPIGKHVFDWYPPV